MVRSTMDWTLVICVYPNDNKNLDRPENLNWKRKGMMQEEEK